MLLLVLNAEHTWRWVAQLSLDITWFLSKLILCSIGNASGNGNCCQAPVAERIIFNYCNPAP
ncbi:SEC14 cytosolic factor family protein / phosphoglyceride transfer family protein [Zea mays]|uniref:SEC14 cytosolic factor family protein / phosphoglyceride transfer family protein n=1 Tax=Zea mays TaxID=4577 RepID=A0A1D6M9P2_MAIZE|nr:SEC14 cytosolic factor family protein / phosphoglyceride transfer family protein [Zea mays]